MSHKLNILIVEDECIIVKELAHTLDDLGYNVVGDAMGAGEALNILNCEKVDLVLLDINIHGEKDGIWIGEYINRNLNIPFIFLTAYSSPTTINRAVKIQPFGYLLKPFQKQEIYATIELAIRNFNNLSRNENSLNKNKCPRCVFVKRNGIYTKLDINDILFVEAQGNYLRIVTLNDELVVRETLTTFSKKLPKPQFEQVHRSFFINFSRVDNVNQKNINIQTYKVPLTKSYKANVISRIKND